MATYYDQTHTYTYPVRAGVEATARLDRLYVSAPLVEWVAAVGVCKTGTRADHKAVRLQLRSPTDPVRVRKPSRVYLPPSVAAEAVRVVTQQRLKTFLEDLQVSDQDAATWARAWDEFKVELRKETLSIIKARRKSTRASYNQKLRRLRKQEIRLQEHRAGTAPTVESITEGMDVLSLRDGHGGSPLQRVRHEIQACTRARADAQQRRLFRAAGHSDGKTTRALFRRVSNKYADNEIHRLDAAIGHSARGVHDKADTLADAWTPIFQQSRSTAAARSEVLHWLGDAGRYQDVLADLTDAFTESEVAAAIGASKPGKACGPDRFGNDWYRDFAELLIPILTKLFNCWYSAGVFPESFLEADIFCLKKGGASQNPLNYRPLALLDTDYKLLTRMLATRTSRKLHWIVHRNQNGFVPFRTIHATVDLFTAAQAAANSDPEMAEALALLLDFRKAYDSVDREFLYEVLAWLGCPLPYVEAIRRLHNGTRVRFLANGYRSRWVKVACGIRQDCPLAPLLFLLVLEALYRRLDASPQVRGIVLRSRAGEVKLKVGGYADDTACYVRSPSEVTVVMDITQLFAGASGLRLNADKTLVIALNPAAIATMAALPKPLVVQAATKLSRYLGIPVGSIPDDDYTWQLARTQLVTRLALAARKTMTADHRSMVFMAIVVPKLLFIGRHIWPTGKMVAAFQKMINNFVWHARFTDDKVSGRAWLNDYVAALPRKHGGLAIPDLRLELLAHAAVTVNRWALEADLDMHIVGDVIAGRVSDRAATSLYISPRHTPPGTKGKRIRPTLWDTGVYLCNTYDGVHTVTEKADMVQALHCTSYFRGQLGLVWKGRRLHVDTTPMKGPLCHRYLAIETGEHGDFCKEWLPYAVLSEMRFFSEQGVVVNPNTRFRAICRRGLLLKDILHWTWPPKGGLLVTALTHRVTPAVRRQVGRLIQLLLLNYPQLIRAGGHWGTVRYSTSVDGHTQIDRRLTENHILAGGGTGTTRPTDPQRIRSHRDLTTAMQHEVGRQTPITTVHPHPRLARLVCLWAGRRRWWSARKMYKTIFGAAKKAKGLKISKQRQDRWTGMSGAVASGLDALAWKRIRRVVGLNPWGEQLLLRMKHHAFSVYSPVSAGLDCRHEGCEHVGRIDLFHIFWECPAARRLREVFVTRWRSAGLKLTNYEEAIFRLALPYIPQGLATATGRIVASLPDEHAVLVGDTADRLIEHCWSLGAALYLLAVWRWRVAHFDVHNDVTTGYHVACLKNRLHQGHLDVTRDYVTRLPPITAKRISDAICQGLGATWAGHEGQEGDPFGAGHCYLVAVAGSSDNTRKSRGSGTVVVKIHPRTGSYALQYVASTHYAGKDMTLPIWAYSKVSADVWSTTGGRCMRWGITLLSSRATLVGHHHGPPNLRILTGKPDEWQMPSR